MRVMVTREQRVDIERLGIELGSIMNFAVSESAKDFAGFVRANYLSGQVLQRETGKTYGSTKFLKRREGEFFVRPGVGVRGMLNYLYKFERGNRSFMGPAARAYARKKEHLDTAKRIFDAVVAKEAKTAKVTVVRQ